jgi:hypothetical protein
MEGKRGHRFLEGSEVPSETEELTPAARRAGVYIARAKMAEDWSAKTADVELRQSWLKIAKEYRLLVRTLSINRPIPNNENASALRRHLAASVVDQDLLCRRSQSQPAEDDRRRRDARIRPTLERT